MSRITLMPARPDHAPLIHAWRTEPSTAKYQPTLPLSVSQVRHMLEEREPRQLGPGSFGKFQWLIAVNDEPAGWITLEISEPARRHHNGVVGYTVAEAFRGRGAASGGLRALAGIAFDADRLALERLEAIAAVDNVASRRVLERNGFLLEGVLRGLLVVHGQRVDHAIYGLLKRDWELT